MTLELRVGPIKDYSEIGLFYKDHSKIGSYEGVLNIRAITRDDSKIGQA